MYGNSVWLGQQTDYCIDYSIDFICQHFEYWFDNVKPDSIVRKPIHAFDNQ